MRLVTRFKISVNFFALPLTLIENISKGAQTLASSQVTFVRICLAMYRLVTSTALEKRNALLCFYLLIILSSS